MKGTTSWRRWPKPQKIAKQKARENIYFYIRYLCIYAFVHMILLYIGLFFYIERDFIHTLAALLPCCEAVFHAKGFHICPAGDLRDSSQSSTSYFRPSRHSSLMLILDLFTLASPLIETKGQSKAAPSCNYKLLCRLLPLLSHFPTQLSFLYSSNKCIMHCSLLTHY